MLDSEKKQMLLARLSILRFLFVALSSYIDVASRKEHLNGRFQTAHSVTI